MMNWDVVLKAFISLWGVIDPIGTIPVFLAVTAGVLSGINNFFQLQ
jgi:multiple antibiotic resistance protein